jgi:hypothetical protein
MTKAFLTGELYFGVPPIGLFIGLFLHRGMRGAGIFLAASFVSFFILLSGLSNNFNSQLGASRTICLVIDKKPTIIH